MKGFETFLYDQLASSKIVEVTVCRNLYVEPRKHKRTGVFYEAKKITRKTVREFTVSLLIAYVVWSNLSAISGGSGPSFWPELAPTLAIEQDWKDYLSLFDSKNSNGFFITVAKLQDGSEVDIFTGGRPSEYKPVSKSKPTNIAGMYLNSRWTRWWLSVWSDSSIRLSNGRFICREWNLSGEHPDQKRLKSFTILSMNKEGDSFKEYIIWQHVC